MTPPIRWRGEEAGYERQSDAVAKAEDVGVDGDCRVAESHIENDIRRLAANAGQGFERATVIGNLAAMTVDQHL